MSIIGDLIDVPASDSSPPTLTVRTRVDLVSIAHAADMQRTISQAADSGTLKSSLKSKGLTTVSDVKTLLFTTNDNYVPSPPPSLPTPPPWPELQPFPPLSPPVPAPPPQFRIAASDGRDAALPTSTIGGIVAGSVSLVGFIVFWRWRRNKKYEKKWKYISKKKLDDERWNVSGGSGRTGDEEEGFDGGMLADDAGVEFEVFDSGDFPNPDLIEHSPVVPMRRTGDDLCDIDVVGDPEDNGGGRGMGGRRSSRDEKKGRKISGTAYSRPTRKPPPPKTSAFAGAAATGSQKSPSTAPPSRLQVVRSEGGDWDASGDVGVGGSAGGSESTAWLVDDMDGTPPSTPPKGTGEGRGGVFNQDAVDTIESTIARKRKELFEREQAAAAVAVSPLSPESIGAPSSSMSTPVTADWSPAVKAGKQGTEAKTRLPPLSIKPPNFSPAIGLRERHNPLLAAKVSPEGPETRSVRKDTGGMNGVIMFDDEAEDSFLLDESEFDSE